MNHDFDGNAAAVIATIRGRAFSAKGAREIIECLMPNVNIQPEFHDSFKPWTKEPISSDKLLLLQAELKLLKEIIVQAVAKAYKP
jgi:hypothetical protein